MEIKLKPSVSGKKYKTIGFTNRADQAIVFAEMRYTDTQGNYK